MAEVWVEMVLTKRQHGSMLDTVFHSGVNTFYPYKADASWLTWTWVSLTDWQICLIFKVWSNAVTEVLSRGVSKLWLQLFTDLARTTSQFAEALRLRKGERPLDTSAPTSARDRRKLVFIVQSHRTCCELVLRDQRSVSTAAIFTVACDCGRGEPRGRG